MSRGLGTLSASPGDLSLIPLTKRQLTTTYDSSSKGSATLASVGILKHAIHEQTHMHRKINLKKISSKA